MTAVDFSAITDYTVYVINITVEKGGVTLGCGNIE